MLKVIIVDDERIIRDTISKLIDWNALGLQLVGTCKNGIEAYDMILDESVDIVLTDIKMPGMNGVELITRISQTDLDTQFILLSGYGEFSYAQEAMKYGVRHYLMKPCNEEQIVRSLKDIIADCYQKHATRQLVSQQGILQRALQKDIIINIFSEVNYVSDHDYPSIFRSYDQYMDFTNTCYEMSYLHGLKETDLTGCYQTILAYHQKQAPGIPLHGIYMKDCLIVFCEGYLVNYDTIDAVMDRCSNDGQTFTRTSRLFSNLSALLNEVLDFTRHYGTLYYVESSHLTPICNYRNVIHDIKMHGTRLCQYYNNESQDSSKNIEKELQDILTHLQGIENIDFLLQLCSNLLLTLATHSVCFSLPEVTELTGELHELGQIPLILSRISSILDSALTVDISKRKKRELISEIKTYVNDHLSDTDLTLKQIAETYLFMNVDYVSKRFIKDTGMKFSAYLTAQRIEKAKYLLSAGKADTVQSVAELVGCGNNPQYFSQVFKKHTGMTPSDYLRSFQ